MPVWNLKDERSNLLFIVLRDEIISLPSRKRSKGNGLAVLCAFDAAELVVCQVKLDMAATEW